jgi:hypothetical protein
MMKMVVMIAYPAKVGARGELEGGRSDERRSAVEDRNDTSPLRGRTAGTDWPRRSPATLMQSAAIACFVAVGVPFELRYALLASP